jgi:hypothetical protein
MRIPLLESPAVCVNTVVMFGPLMVIDEPPKGPHAKEGPPLESVKSTVVLSDQTAEV